MADGLRVGVLACPPVPGEFNLRANKCHVHSCPHIFICPTPPSLSALPNHKHIDCNRYRRRIRSTRNCTRAVSDRPSFPQRAYTCMEKYFASFAGQVHKVDTGCTGPLTTKRVITVSKWFLFAIDVEQISVGWTLEAPKRTLRCLEFCWRGIISPGGLRLAITAI